MISPVAEQTMIYALDFDGVICDSALELAMSGWQVARQIWPDMPESYDQATLDAYREVRPIIETGYETIPILRLLQQGVSVEDLASAYPDRLATTIQSANIDAATLKQLFGEFRDRWIATDEADWLDNNPLFPTIAEKLKALDGQVWYIITTKQERFARKILQANDIHIPAERLFGMDRNMSKQVVLEGILRKHRLPVTFVEDRYQTLTGVLNNNALSSILLQLAAWGYNTAREREIAPQLAIEVVSIEQFLEQ